MQLFSYNYINKKKVKTIISNCKVKLGFRNHSVLIIHNSSIQHKTALCIYVMHPQFVKRFYPGGPKNLPKGHASSTSAPGNSSKPNIINPSQTSSHVPQKLSTTITSNNQNVSNNSALKSSSFSHQKWPSANAPVNNSTFGDGKMSPMEFAKQQAIKQKQLSTTTENKERAVVVYKKAPSLPMSIAPSIPTVQFSERVWIVDSLGNTFPKENHSFLPPTVFDVWNPPVTFVTQGGSTYDHLPKHLSESTNKSGKTFETIIGPDTTITEVKRPIILNELRRREMVKEDDHTQSQMQASDGTKIIIGKANNGVKLTPHGAAYHAQIKNSTNPVTHIPAGENTAQGNTLDIIAPPVPDSKICLVMDSKQTHMYVARLIGGFFYSPGCLTGHNQGQFLHDKKFSTYQKEQENENFIQTNTKKQNFIEFQNLIRIPQGNAIVLAHGTHYIKYIQGEEYINKRFKALQEKPIIEYDMTGLTKQNAIDMCIKHDYNVANKIPHPKTVNQIKQEAENKQKMKDSYNNNKNEYDKSKNYSKTHDVQ